ncbi:MAG: hypothetical protein HUU55_15760, partial [Myxococcales bacterium]|nr:hypothetical protein [Myxococcales bacterium]
TCNDNNQCTTDTCTAAAGCVFTNNTNTCNDNNACTSGDKCANGLCSGTTITCNDSNICTNDTCTPSAGCVFTNNTNPCNDNNACSSGDVCVNGTCKGNEIVCNDGNPCTNDSCNTSTGCVTTNNTANCNDNNLCTTGDKCANGQCSGTAVVCNDNNPCTNDSCSTSSGSCVFSPNSSATCSDGNLCTTSDKCTNGQCVGTPVVCNDLDPCTVDSCSPNTGGCIATFNTTDPDCSPKTYTQIQTIVFGNTCSGCHGVQPSDPGDCNSFCDGGKCFAFNCSPLTCGTSVKGNTGLEECEPGSGVFMSTAECLYQRAVRGFPSVMPPDWSGIVLTTQEKKAISGWWHSIKDANAANWCPAPPQISYSQQVQPIWNKWCTNCHGVQGGLNLSSAVSYNNLVNVNSTCNSLVKRVTPGNTAASMLWRKIANTSDKCGSAMPLVPGGLISASPSEAALVEQWILQGALKN